VLQIHRADLCFAASSTRPHRLCSSAVVCCGEFAAADAPDAEAVCLAVPALEPPCFGDRLAWPWLGAVVARLCRRTAMVTPWHCSRLVRLHLLPFFLLLYAML
jgi:hypothetical protein